MYCLSSWNLISSNYVFLLVNGSYEDLPRPGKVPQIVSEHLKVKLRNKYLFLHVSTCNTNLRKKCHKIRVVPNTRQPVELTGCLVHL